MKHIFFTLFFMTALSSHISCAMEAPFPIVALDVTDSLKDRIIFTDLAINVKYKKMSQRPLTEKKMISLLKMIAALPGNHINPLFIEKLYKKNIYFMHTINYFCELATKNLEGVTCDTLEIILDHLQNQPLSQLNKLPFPFKKYAMKKAYHAVRCVYSVIFEGHTDTVENVDTNMIANLAASASKDGTFCLWKLSNGELLHTFDAIANYGYVKFNGNGSQLATATVYKQNPNKTRISIWDIPSKQLLYQLKQNGPVTHLNFFPDENNTLLAVGKKDHLLLYKLKQGSSAVYLGSISEGIRTKTETTPYAKESDNHSWLVSKNSRSLGVCEYALRNTKSEKSLMTITQIPIYKESLTEHEQEILKIKLTQRIESLASTKTLHAIRTFLG